MAALDFPASPVDGQVYSNWVYSSSKGAWQAKPLTPGQAQPSATAPTSPSNGDQWYNTNDGNLYIYYNDGDTSQWVQVKSDATLSSTLGNRVTTLETYPSGLVPIVPTSVTVGSGSSTVTENGLISFTSASNITLNGVFSSAYQNYRIMWRSNASVDTSTSIRFSTSGTPNTTAVYNNHLAYWGATGVGNIITTNQTSIGGIFGHAYQRVSVEILYPNLTEMTVLTWYGAGLSTVGNTEQHVSSGVFKNSVSFDGIYLWPGSGTFTGNVEVYGYRK